MLRLGVRRLRLLGAVPFSLRDGIVVAHIPEWLEKDAKQHGFEIVAVDWKRNCYTLRVVTPNAKVSGAGTSSAGLPGYAAREET